MHYYRTMNRRGMEFTPIMQEFLNGNGTGKFCTTIFRNGKIDPIYVDVDQNFLDSRLKSC